MESYRADDKKPFIISQNSVKYNSQILGLILGTNTDKEGNTQ